MDGITIGADPEVFLQRQSDDSFVSAIGIIPGNKKNPHPTDFGAVQADGNAAEFNIIPANNQEEFTSRLQSGLDYISDLVHKHGLKVSLSPVAEFDPDYFLSLPPEAFVLGCDPDFNGRNGGSMNSAPDIAFHPIRTSSGHIHVGFPKDILEKFEGASQKYPMSPSNRLRLKGVFNISRALTHAAKIWENNLSNVRRQYYGDNFAFRVKDYGLELRTLDALWLQDKVFMKKVYDAAFQSASSFVLSLRSGTSDQVSDSTGYIFQSLKDIHSPIFQKAMYTLETESIESDTEEFEDFPEDFEDVDIGENEDESEGF